MNGTNSSGGAVEIFSFLCDNSSPSLTISTPLMCSSSISAGVSTPTINPTGVSNVASVSCDKAFMRQNSNQVRLSMPFIVSATSTSTSTTLSIACPNGSTNFNALTDLYGSGSVVHSTGFSAYAPVIVNASSETTNAIIRFISGTVSAMNYFCVEITYQAI